MIRMRNTCMYAGHLLEHRRQGLAVVDTVDSVSDHWSHGQLLDLTCRLDEINQ